ncbi:hypothetical protein HDU78_001945 [Chytriomyces hyalinus]|nr:hypothetical protein HDU78_001945 [Chytriomyces hyalinus]
MFATASRDVGAHKTASKPSTAARTANTVASAAAPKTARKPPSSSVKKGSIAPAAEPKLAPTKISNRSVPKAILDLGLGNHKTAFSAAYSKGGFPCRLEHGSVKHKVSWAQPVESISYNPLLATLFEGLRETEHPFLFLVPHAVKDMLQAHNSREKVEPMIASAIPSLRHALSSKHKSTILSSLETVKHLGACLGSSLLPYLPSLLPPIALHSHSRDNQIRETVVECLQGVESAIAYDPKNSGTVLAEEGGGRKVEVSSAGGGLKEKRVVNLGEWIGVGGGDRGVGGSAGAEALKMIKAKIPTYSSVFG